jgi:hypothetical protein
VLLTGGAIEVGPIVQLEPVQLSANRLVEPSGVRASGRMEPPSPMFRPPQVRFLMRTLLPRSVLPQVPPGTPVVKSRNAPPTDMVVVVEVVVEVEVAVVGGHVDVEEWHRHSCCPEQFTVAKQLSNG